MTHDALSARIRCQRSAHYVVFSLRLCNTIYAIEYMSYGNESHVTAVAADSVFVLMAQPGVAAAARQMAGRGCRRGPAV